MSKPPWTAIVEVDGMTKDKDYIYVLREFRHDSVLCRGSLQTVFAMAEKKYPNHRREQHPTKARCYFIKHP